MMILCIECSESDCEFKTQEILREVVDRFFEDGESYIVTDFAAPCRSRPFKKKVGSG